MNIVDVVSQAFGLSKQEVKRLIKSGGVYLWEPLPGHTLEVVDGHVYSVPLAAWQRMAELRNAQ